jgi:hypothetical protein
MFIQHQLLSKHEPSPHTALTCACRTLSAANSRGRSLTDGGSFTAAGGWSGAGAGDESEREAPLLHLPQLNTGLSEAEIKDLAYLVFASNCGNGADGERLAWNPAFNCGVTAELSAGQQHC